MTTDPRAQALVSFWQQAGMEKWFSKDDAFDQALKDRFSGLHDAAAAGALSAWEGDADGAWR